MSGRLGGLATALVLTLALTGAGAPGLADWEPVRTKDGIEVSQREVPDRALPVMRGVGVIEANLYEILAVIQDVDRHPQWMYSCKKAWLVRRESERVSYVYNRTDAPWPARDRDVVVRAETVIVEPGREIHSLFRSTGEGILDKVKGAVRMVRLDGHYKLKALDVDRTHVEYEVDADPGGGLPTWMVKLFSRDMPLETLVGLREQVERTRGSYDDLLDRWDPDRR